MQSNVDRLKSKAKSVKIEDRLGLKKGWDRWRKGAEWGCKGEERWQEKGE